MSVAWDFIAKLVVIGDSGTGKSSLTIRLCEDRFVQQHDVTIGVEFGSKIVPVGPPESLTAEASKDVSSRAQTSLNRHQSRQQQQQQQQYMKLSLWDTAGQETYKSITKSYFRGASGALLVFDISRKSTFDSATRWLSDLRQIAEQNIVVILVGNKLDLVRGETSPDESSETRYRQLPDRQVTAQDARQWCQLNGVLAYVETSAKNGEGVKEAFRGLANRIYQNIEAGKYDMNDRRSGVKSARPDERTGPQSSPALLVQDRSMPSTRCC